MEDDTWSFAFSTTSSRSYQSALRSLSGEFHAHNPFGDLEDVDGDNNYHYSGDDYEDEAEYPCPFCSEDFDLVELCDHIDDDHPFEANPGICPVCTIRTGINMVRHITTQHGNMFKRLQKLKLQKDGSYSTLSLLKKELDDGYFQSLLDVQSPVVSSSKMEPDPLLSFLYRATPVDKSESSESPCLTNIDSEDKSLNENILERDVHQSHLSDKEQIEKGRRSQFVQELLLSTIIDDGI